MKRQKSRKILALVMALVLALGAFIGVWAEEGVTEIPVTEEIVMPEAPAEETPADNAPVAEAPADESPIEEIPVEASVEEAIPEEVPAETPTEETPAEEVLVAEVPAEEIPAEETPVEEMPAETPVEEAVAEEPVMLKKGLALIVKKADVTKKAESHKAVYVLSKDALVLAEELEGNAERVKVQFILNGEKVTGFVETGAVAFIEGEPDGKYAALAVGSLYEMADYAVEVVEEPVIEEVVEEPSAEEITEEAVIEEVAEEPVAEETVIEEVVEAITEEPAVEEITEEPVADEVPEEPVTEETVEEPVIEETIGAPAVEETVEVSAVEEVKIEPVTEPISEVPVTPVVTPEPTPAPAPAEAQPAAEVVPVEEPLPEEAARADVAKIREYVERCYTVILGRKGEEGGVTNWINQLSSGAMGGAAVVRGFVASQEFIGKNYSPKQVVTILYQAMLGRDPDAAGLNDWIEHMEVGMTSDAIVAGFTGSQEFGNICNQYGILPGNFTPTEWRDRNYGVTAFVFRAYKLILNRAAEPAGQNNWCAELLSGRMAGADIVMQFLGSQEFLNRYKSVDALVDILYNTMLGRNADAAGKADWVGKLKNKQQVSAIVNGFSGSQEFMGICRQYGINPGTVNVATAPHVHAWDDGLSVSGGTRYTCYICFETRTVKDPDPTPTPTPEPTPTPTPTITDPVTAEAYLKDYISQNGSTNSDGNKYIDSEFSGSHWGIVYNKSTGNLEFYESYSNSYSGITTDEAVYMVLTGPILYPEYEYEQYRGMTERVKGIGTINRATYSMGTRDTVEWSLDKDDPFSVYVKDARSFFWWAISHWDRLIKETTGLRMRNLGFTSLDID